MKKAPSGAFFVFGVWVFVFFALSPAVSGAVGAHEFEPPTFARDAALADVSVRCNLQPSQMKGKAWRSAQVSRVLDGDTLELVGGERVRMVGVNAPEIAHGERPADPLGNRAWQRLEALSPVGSVLFFRRDRSGRDRYGRSLLHPYNAAGQNLSAGLLADGLGFRVSLPPDLWRVDCYRAAEQAARTAGRGVWNPVHWPVVDLGRLDEPRGGYQRVRGHLERVVVSQWRVWLELKGGVAIKVTKADLAFVDGEVWQRVLQAAQQQNLSALPALELQGWLSDRESWPASMREAVMKESGQRFQIKLRHRYDWRFDEEHLQSSSAQTP
ncbi:Probable nuclease [gamma proteobacterium HdN1]|nr:Probable nuclease [gamma proteobacterium HdN1]